MKSFDYDAVVYDGVVWCVPCFERLHQIDTDALDVHPIFGDSEWDYYPVCEGCWGVQNYVNLTDAGRIHELKCNRCIRDRSTNPKYTDQLYYNPVTGEAQLCAECYWHSVEDLYIPASCCPVLRARQARTTVDPDELLVLAHGGYAADCRRNPVFSLECLANPDQFARLEPQEEECRTRKPWRS